MNSFSNQRAKNTALLKWVDDMAALCEPDRIHWCDGSQDGIRPAVRARWSTQGTLHPAEPEASARTAILARSDPDDVARVEDRTFICSHATRTTPARPTTGSTRRR